MFQEPLQTYEHLLDRPDETKAAQADSPTHFRKCPRRVLVLVIIAQVIYNAVATWFLLSKEPQCGPAHLQTLYSPASEALELEIVKFHQGDGRNLTIFEDAPSPEVDAAWESLYEKGMSKIPKHQAALLTNKTSPILGDEGNYVVSLGYLMQNMIRKALHPDYYPPMNASDTEIFSHVGHCVDTIRQSLMCTSDISTIVYQWDETIQKVKTHADIPHTCRKFDRIREWATDHRMGGKLNRTANVEDDIEIAEF